MPYELRFDRRTDMAAAAADLCEGLGLVLERLEKIASTAELVRYAVENKLLIEYQKTCWYLAATDDVDTLTRYVATLHGCFGHQRLADGHCR